MSILSHLVGPPPAPDAAPEDKGRYARRYFIRINLPILAAMWAATLIFSPVQLLVFPAGLTAAWLWIVRSLSGKIREAERHRDG